MCFRHRGAFDKQKRSKRWMRKNDMKVNCLSCGHKVDLDDAYDNYEGQVRCLACGAVLEIKTEEGSLKSVKLAKAPPRRSTDETF